MNTNGEGEKLTIPAYLKKTGGAGTSPVYFIDTRDKNLDPADSDCLKDINVRIRSVLEELLPAAGRPPSLVKIHPGEPKAETGIAAGLLESQLALLKDRGLGPVIGDSTVIYTGDRGCRNNPPDDVSAYMGLVEKNRWSRKHTGVPFVIIDRPVSSAPGIFEFEEEEIFKKVESPGCYKGVFVSGGMHAASLILNNAHLTMHGLSPIALCVKAIAMGGASANGKKQMHMNLAPRVDRDLCKACGICIENCPFDALYAGEDKIPELYPGKCAGCGECMALCPFRAITMFHEGRVKWDRGTDSFLARLYDFTVSMMNGTWERLINIGHLYQITAQCDCMNTAQKPILGDIGIIISRNPFAADMLAAELFSAQARREKKDYPLGEYTESFRYLEQTYGIRVNPEVISA